MTGIVGLLTLTLVFIWMNRFQYEHTGTTQVLVRINRFTGQQCFLTTDRGWDSQLIRTPKDEQFSKDGGQETSPSAFSLTNAENNECR